MSYNGSGTFQINTAGQPVVAGTVISSTAFNSLTADLANGLSTAITKDGQTTVTNNIPMAGFKITGLGAATVGTDAARYSQIQGGTDKLITVTGTDTLTGSLTPALTAYAAGNQFSFVVANTNTGAVTINIDGVGVKSITKSGSTALAAGDLTANSIALIEYDGTRFQLINVATGNVTGPASSTANAIPTFSGTTGKIIQNNSGVKIVSNNITMDGSTSGTLTVAASAIAGTNTLTLPATTGMVAVSSVSTDYILSPYTGFKNRIINGAMAIDQRNAGASLAVTAGTIQYSVDRFFGISSNAQCTLQQVTTSDSDFPYALRLARTTGGVGTGVIQGGQIIETNNCQDLAGQTVTLSFYATAGANFSAASSQIVVGLTCGSGTNQGAAAAFITGTWTSQTTPLSTNQTITTTRTKYTYSVSIPSGTNEIGIRWYYTPVGTAGANDWFQVTGVQLEKGSTATSFEYRAYGTELALCQRYYCKTFDIGTAPGNNVSGAGELLATNINQATYEPGAIWRFPVAMRAVPTLTLYNPGAGTASQWYDGTNSSANARAVNAGTSGAWLDNSGTSIGGTRYRIQAVAAIEL